MFSKFLIIPTLTAITSVIPTLRAMSSFSNMLLIIFKNTDYAKAITDPNFSAFASAGKLFTNWEVVSHPSQSNYIGITSGALNSIMSDSSIMINVENVVDLLKAKGLTWKSYQENWPGKCSMVTELSDSLYFR